jgi:hypothetical protein
VALEGWIGIMHMELSLCLFLYSDPRASWAFFTGLSLHWQKEVRGWRGFWELLELSQLQLQHISSIM